MPVTTRWLWSRISRSIARVAGSTRVIDRYAGAVSGSLDAFDRELSGPLSRRWSSILRLTSRHPVAGWYADDLLLEWTGLWLMNKALEQSACQGMNFGTRLFQFGGFVLSTAAATPVTDAGMDALRDDLWTRYKPEALTDAEVITLYWLTMALGLVARHRSALDGLV